MSDTTPNPPSPTLAEMVQASEAQIAVQKRGQVYSEQLRKTENRLRLYTRLMAIYGGEFLFGDLPASAWSSSGQAERMGTRLDIKA